MKSKMKIRIRVSIKHMALLIALLVASPMVRAQAASRLVGTVTAISGTTLTIKTDAGTASQVEVPSTTVLKQITPGQKSLAGAATIQFSDIAVGDRTLIMLDTKAVSGTLQALQIVAVKQTDLAKKQAQEREDWQLRGAGGLVKTIDPQTGVIVVTNGAGPLAKTITIQTTSATILKRYAPASVTYDEAKPAPISAIHAGDQLRARGAKNADGTQIAAEEVVSGSFRNISGTITSLDTGGSTITVKDLATKQQVKIRITPETQMHRLPERMATMLGALLKGDAGSAAAGRAAFQRGGAGGQGGGQARSPGGEFQQMLARAPEIPIADLKKDEAVILVSTEGATDVTAITLLAGVEPLLEAPAGRDLLSNWSMDSGAGAGDAAQ